MLFGNGKVSKGTTNLEEMDSMLKKIEKMMADIMGNQIQENYFIIDELNPSAWDFDGISIKERSKLESI